MNLSRVARLLAGFVLFFSVAQLVPLTFSLFEDHQRFPTVAGFAGSIAVGCGTAALLWTAGRRSQADLGRREGLVVVGCAWILAGVLGAVPFVWSGTLTSAAAALFESVSGLTTTGASAFGSATTMTIEELPRSILFWRVFLQFLGGMGVVLLFILLLPAMGVTGKNVLASEQTGVTTELHEPRLIDQARMLMRCYLVLNLLCTLGYWAAGLSLFDALSHAFATIATGGFSNRNASIGGYANLGVESVGTVFMFLGGCSFAWLATLARGGVANVRDVLRTPELRAYVSILLACIGIVALSLWTWGGRSPDVEGLRDYSRFGRCLRDAAFNVTSMFTSSGFASADFQNWPSPALLCITLGMLMGACTGSTSGGMKVLRLAVCARLIAYHTARFVRPRSVARLKLGGEVVADPVVSAILAIVVLWLATVGFGTFVLALDHRLDLQSCFTAAATLMGNSGPALTAVVHHDSSVVLANAGHLNLGPYGSFGDLRPWGLLWGSAQMLLGRLEVLTLLVLLNPRFWSR
ncbi:MAG: TrkH family potassium uptake protein [Planctomycetota bacterium]